LLKERKYRIENLKIYTNGLGIDWLNPSGTPAKGKGKGSKISGELEYGEESPMESSSTTESSEKYGGESNNFQIKNN